MLYKLQKISSIFLLVLFCCLFTKSDCKASSNMYDDFTSKNDIKWNFSENGGQIEVVDNSLLLDSTYYYFPFVINKNDDLFPVDKDFVLTIKFKYGTTNGYMGDGMGIGFTGSGGKLFSQFGIWRDKLNGSSFYYNDFNNSIQGFCSDFSRTSDHYGRNYVNLYLGLGEWHDLRIERIDTTYKIFIDPETNPDPIYVTQSNQCIPKFIWFGNNSSGGGRDWNPIYVDYIKIGQEPLNDSRKIFILPGLGASWNSNAFVYGEDVTSDQWKMTPFVKTYDGLISALKKNNLVENEDFYVWNYDWRKPIDQITNDFNNYINSKISETDEIVLIGHSLGGVVARIWDQKYGSDKNINLYTLGSPHYGSLKAYEAWSGGKLSESPDISSIAINLLIQLNKKNSENNLTSFRDFAPVLKDLLPTFDFLKKNNKVVSVNNMESKNLYLSQKNEEVKSKNLNLTSYTGTGQETNEWINMVDRSVFDKVLGIWHDGKPVNYINGEGDKTVLKKSANLIGFSSVEIISNHNDIVNKSIDNILSDLNLSDESSYTVDDFSNSLVFFIGSPADISVKCDNESAVNDQDGLIIIKDKNYKKCVVNLRGTGLGKYHLITGKTDQIDNWNYIENEINADENYDITVNPDNGEILNDDSNVLFLNKMIEKDIKLLMEKYKNNKHLSSSLKDFRNKKIYMLVDDIFKFRKETKEDDLSNEILDYSKVLLEIYNKKYSGILAKFDHLEALQNKILTDKLTLLNTRKGYKVNVFSANSYLKAKKLIEQSSIDLKDNKHASVLAGTYLGRRYLNEVWYNLKF